MEVLAIPTALMCSNELAGLPTDESNDAHTFSHLRRRMACLVAYQIRPSSPRRQAVILGGPEGRGDERIAEQVGKVDARDGVKKRRRIRGRF
jgi:hypothetical protein